MYLSIPLLYKSVLISLFVFLIGGVQHFVYAQEQQAPDAFIVAQVSAYDGEIVSQEGNRLTVTFTLLNQAIGVQPDVRYAIELYKLHTDSEKTILVDRKSFVEPLALQQDNPVEVRVSYEAPSGIDGVFRVGVVVYTGDGLPLAETEAGVFRLKGARSVLAAPICVLEEGGMDQSSHVREPGEALRIHCEHSFPEESFKVFYTTYEAGKGKSEELAKTSSVANDNSELSFLVLSASDSGAYDVSFQFVGDTFLSGITDVSYVVSGNHEAVIKSIASDMDAYEEGSTPSIGVVIEAVYVGADDTDDAFADMDLSITIADRTGNICGEETISLSGEWPRSNIALVDSPVYITQSCEGAIVTGVISKHGELIDQTTVTTKPDKFLSSTALILAIVVLVVIVLSVVFRKNSKKAIVGVITVVCLAGAFIQTVEADTKNPVNPFEAVGSSATIYYREDWGDPYTPITFSLNKPVFYPGEHIEMLMHIHADAFAEPNSATWGMNHMPPWGLGELGGFYIAPGDYESDSSMKKAKIRWDDTGYYPATCSGDHCPTYVEAPEECGSGYGLGNVPGCFASTVYHVFTGMSTQYFFGPTLTFSLEDVSLDVSLTADAALIPYDGSVQLTWTTENALNCTASADPANTQWTGAREANGGEQTISNLTEDTHFFIECENVVGDTLSDDVWVYVDTPQPPTSPTGLQASCQDGTQVTLSWNSSSGASTYPYRLDRTPFQSDPCQGTPGDECNNSNTSTSRTFSIDSDTEYRFWVHAVNGEGWSDAATVYFSCTEPLGPCENGVDDDGDGWIDNADPGCYQGGNYAPGDTSESNNEFECSDGIDNDGDGLIDGADPDCTAGDDDIEATLPNFSLSAGSIKIPAGSKEGSTIVSVIPYHSFEGDVNLSIQSVTPPLAPGISLSFADSSLSSHEYAGGTALTASVLDSPGDVEIYSIRIQGNSGTLNRTVDTTLNIAELVSAYEDPGDFDFSEF